MRVYHGQLSAHERKLSIWRTCSGPLPFFSPALTQESFIQAHAPLLSGMWKAIYHLPGWLSELNSSPQVQLGKSPL